MRWNPPQELPPHNGSFYADKYGKSSLQLYKRADEISEDCLYLNIRTPATDDGKRPVCVFIHGGGNTQYSGSEDLWQGTSFVDDGVVFVTINYRLGAAGFLYLDEIDPAFQNTGYLGLLDQIAALKWVKTNISMFGGDPDNVTVMGESAGAASISLLMSMPQASGLFSKAILESGSTNLRRTRADATLIARRFMKTANVQNTADLRKLSSEQLLQTQKKLMAEYGWMAGDAMFAPVSDNVNLPDEPLKAIRAGSARGVTLLSGTNRDELSMIKLWMPSDFFSITTFRWFSPNDVQALFGMLDGAAADYYHKLNPGFSASECFFAAGTDAIFFTPHINLCDAQQLNAPVYSYRFDWGGKYGAIHGLELYCVFSDFNDGYLDNWIGALPPEELRQSVHKAWVEFIKTGSPAVDDTLLWMPYNTIQRPTMTLNVKSRLRCDPDRIVREYWQAHEHSILYR